MDVKETKLLPYPLHRVKIFIQNNEENRKELKEDRQFNIQSSKGGASKKCKRGGSISRIEEEVEERKEEVRIVSYEKVRSVQRRM